jgi:trimethylamine-N-oxide reductase (cytochrome c)
MWFMETVGLLFSGNPDYGVDVGHGVRRYTNNTNGGRFRLVRDGRIIRVTPIEFDGRDPAPWTIEARGRKLTPPRKGSLAPYALPPSRWSIRRTAALSHETDGFRSGRPAPSENGAPSGYERISWDRPWTSWPTRSSGSNANMAPGPS